jgi:SAM-dependent methyltransferase
MSEVPELWHISHFDLMDDYDGEIPSHVAIYLNDLKTKKTIDAIMSFLPHSESLVGLDVGCGTGDHALTIQERLPNSVVHGLDGSSKQLERAKEKNFPNKLIHASMNATGLQNDCVDFIVAVNSIHHLPSIESQRDAFREFSRILNHNGILIIHEISVRNPLMRIYMKLIFPRTRSIDNGTEIFMREPPIENSNFTIVDTTYFTFVPDFTPRWLMPMAIKLDKILSRSRLRFLGAHVLWILLNEKN